MLKLLGRANSINVQKVVWCVLELGIPFERKDIGGAFGGNDTPEYLALNPNGRVPTIIDGDVVLWESNAIVRYLSAKHGEGTLSPRDVAKRADADRWMDWQTTTLTPATHPAFWGLIRTPEEKRDMAAIAKSIAESEAKMRILERVLADRAYITGDTFTMGDIPIGCAAHRWLHLPIERPSLPAVQRWYERLMQRSPAQTVLTAPLT